MCKMRKMLCDTNSVHVAVRHPFMRLPLISFMASCMLFQPSAPSRFASCLSIYLSCLCGLITDSSHIYFCLYMHIHTHKHAPICTHPRSRASCHSHTCIHKHKHTRRQVYTHLHPALTNCKKTYQRYTGDRTTDGEHSAWVCGRPSGTCPYGTPSLPGLVPSLACARVPPPPTLSLSPLSLSPSLSLPLWHPPEARSR